MKRIYYLSANNGDGSSSTHFFKEEPDLDAMIDRDPERWGQNDSVEWFDVDADGNVSGIDYSDGDSDY